MQSICSLPAAYKRQNHIAMYYIIIIRYFYFCLQLMELISSALRDLSEAEFVGRRDLQNNPLPSPFEPLDRQLGSDRLRFNPLQPSGPLNSMPITPALRDWTRRNVLSAGSLLGKSCQGALLLAGHGEKLQKQGFSFGKHLSLAWQVNHLYDLNELNATDTRDFPSRGRPHTY